MGAASLSPLPTMVDAQETTANRGSIDDPRVKGASNLVQTHFSIADTITRTAGDTSTAAVTVAPCTAAATRILSSLEACCGIKGAAAAVGSPAAAVAASMIGGSHPPASHPDSSASTLNVLGSSAAATAAASPGRSSASFAKLALADAAMIFCQLLFFVNHYRRLLDASFCSPGPEFPGHPASLLLPPRAGNPASGPGAAAVIPAPTPGPLAGYPCAAALTVRLVFLLAHGWSTLRGAFQLPAGELWVPVVASAILAHLLALLLLPRRRYLAGCRRGCMVLVGLLPKAVSLGTYLAWPDKAPSSYFSIYLPLEGAITLWQHVVYNYSFWPGMAVLAAHCALSTTICLTVTSRTAVAATSPHPGDDGAGPGPQSPPTRGLHAPLFTASWVLAQTYSCAFLAIVVSLQQNPTSAGRLRCFLARVAGSGGAEAAVPAASRRGPSGAACDDASKDWGNGGDAAISADADDSTQLLQVVRKLVGAATPKSFSAVGSLASSLSSSESPSAAGSGSHAAAAGLIRLSASEDVIKAAAAASEKPPPPPPSALKAGQGKGNQAAVAAAKLAAAAAAAAAGPSSPTTANSSGSAGPGPAPARGSRPTYVPFTAGPARVAAAAMPPSGAFSLKQPTGLSKLTIVEDQEFSAPPAAVGLSSSPEAISVLSSRSRRFKRYTSRAVPPQRVYMKIPWAEPDQLPGNFLERLNLALAEGLDCMAVGVAARAGCIELVFDIVPHAAYDSATDCQLELSRPGASSRPQPHSQRHQQFATRLSAQSLQLLPGPSSAQGELHAPPANRNLAVRPVAARAAAAEAIAVPRGAAGCDSSFMGGLYVLGGTSGVSASHGGDGGSALWSEEAGQGVADALSHGVDSSSTACLLDSHGALEEAVLSGLLADVEPASWIDALHLQPPPGAEVLTQACGRVWISRWDHTLRQWMPKKAGGIRPSQLPRITHLHPPCILLSNPAATAAAAASGPAAPPPSAAGTAAAVASLSASGLSLVVSNADSEPSFSARCRGRYLPVAVQHMQWSRPSASGSNAPAPGPAAPAPEPAGPEEYAAAAAQAPGQVPAAQAGGVAGSDDDSAYLLGRVRSPGGPAVVHLALQGGLPRNGLVVVECKVGKLLSNWRPILITEDLHLASELATLYDTNEVLAATRRASSAAGAAAADGGGGAVAASAADAGAASWDELLTDLGLWLDYVEVLGLNGLRPSAPGVGAGAGGGGGGVCDDGVGGGSAGPSGALARQSGSLDFGPGLAALYGMDSYRQHMAGIAVSLLEFAVDRGWTHTAGLLVRQTLSAGITWGEVLQRCSDGLTLLHRAVRSGAGEMVEMVMEMGKQHGRPFDWQAAAGSTVAAADGDGEGVTPLHLAAVLPDGGRLAERILSEYEAACALWASALDSYGVRPVDCARASGHLHLTGAAREQQPGAEEPRTPKQQPAAAGAAAATAAATFALAAAVAMATAGDSSASAVFTSTSGSSFSGPSKPVTDAAPAVKKQAGESVAAAATADTGNGSVSGSCRRSVAVAVVVSTAAALRCLGALLAAPLLSDRRAESQFVRAVGIRYVLWSCCYLMYQVSLVVAVGGRMVKESRAHEMYGMLMFFSPHLASALLLCLDYGAWLRLREPLCAAVTVTRSLAKMLPVLDVLPYPESSSKYMTWGMDVLLEGLMPALFENMRTPLVLPLRTFEGVATGLLYYDRGMFSSLPYALLYALAWTLGCGLLTAFLDARNRRLLLGPRWESTLTRRRLLLS